MEKPSIWTPQRAGMNAAGRIETQVYFVNKAGHIVIAVHTGQPTPRGYSREEAHTLSESKALSERFAKQQMDRFALMDAEELIRRERFFQRLIDNARRTINSAATLQSERDFLRSKVIPKWEDEKNAGKLYREFHFHQEAFEAGHGDE
jgi:hypothetical protein